MSVTVFSFVFLLLAVSARGKRSVNRHSQNCEASGCPLPEVTARSCLDYLKKGFKTNGFYQIYDFNANSFVTVYCDMDSEPGSAWTLIESYSYQNNDMQQFKNHPLSTSVPVNEKSPNWNLYRMSLSQMNHLKSRSSHWRATCSFPTRGVDYTDYVRGKFADFDIMTFLGYGICKKVEYVNIRGHRCVQCTTKWWQLRNRFGPHIDSSEMGCKFAPTAEAVFSEDNFGSYYAINKKFRCTASDSSTTNWWFGGYL